MTVNIENADFDEPRGQDGFRARRARIGRQAGAAALRPMAAAALSANSSGEGGVPSFVPAMPD